MREQYGLDRQLRHRHRCFVCVLRGRKGKEDQRFICRNFMPWLDRDIPAVFTWSKPADVGGLHKYIDALLTCDTQAINTYENSGVISDITRQEPATEQVVRITIESLIDVLTLRDSFNIPVGMRLNFCSANKGARLVARSFIAALLPYAPDLDAQAQWELTHNTTQLPMALKDITTSLNRSPYEAAPITSEALSDEPTAFIDEAGVTTPAEIEIVRRRLEHYAVLLTMVEPPGSKAFFAQRLLDYQGNLLWVGSSWHQHGPWRVTHRDAPRMLALGVKEPA